jgi:hypothetical protein
MDILNLAAAVCSVLGAIIAIWQAYRAKTFRDEVSRDRTRLMLIDAVGVARGARAECQKIMTPVGRRLRGVNEQGVIDAIRACVERIKDNAHRVSCEELNRLTAALEARALTYTSTSGEKERGEVGDAMYSDLNRVIELLSRRLDEEL